MALTSRSSVKSVLGIPTGVTRSDALIDLLVDVANELVLDEIDLPAETVATYSETLDVDYAAQREVPLRYRPVVSVVALTIGASVPTDTDYTFTSSGSIRLVADGAYFPIGRQQVEVTYTAGFSSTPADLAHAATLIAVQAFNQGGHAGFDSERVSTYSYRLDGSTVPPLAQRILNRYRRAFARSTY
jgi:hypothetical protein